MAAMSPFTDPERLPSDVQRTFEESELLLSLYRALIEARDLASGLSNALEIVCRLTGWVLGTAWIPMEGEEHLTLYSSWHLENLQLNNFVERCRQQRFHRDVGIAGRVWHRARAEWTRNLAAEPADSFPLSPAAAAADLRAAFAAPVIRDAMVEAVLFFHAHELKEADERLIAVISRVATQLGFALRHKQLEERLTKQYAVVTHMRDSLEEEVSRRTGELTQTNELLEAEIATREQIQANSKRISSTNKQ